MNSRKILIALLVIVVILIIGAFLARLMQGTVGPSAAPATVEVKPLTADEQLQLLQKLQPSTGNLSATATSPVFVEQQVKLLDTLAAPASSTKKGATASSSLSESAQEQLLKSLQAR